MNVVVPCLRLLHSVVPLALNCSVITIPHSVSYNPKSSTTKRCSHAFYRLNINGLLSKLKYGIPCISALITHASKIAPSNFDRAYMPRHLLLWVLDDIKIALRELSSCLLLELRTTNTVVLK